MNNPLIEQHPIVLYDGECSFCNASVQWLIQHDRHAKLKYAAIKGQIGQDLIQKYAIPSSVDSIIFINDSKAYLYSSAALRLTTYLSGAWPILYCLCIIPSCVRDFVYKQFAKRRISWFGKQQACLLPSSDIRKRFLD